MSFNEAEQAKSEPGAGKRGARRAPKAKGGQGLILVQRAEEPLSKAQATFNRLVRRIEKLRREIEKTRLRLDRDLEFYVKRILPLEQSLVPLRKAVVRLLYPFLGDKRLRGKSDRADLRRILRGLLDGILASEASLQEDDLNRIYREVEGITLEEAQQAAADGLKAEIGSMFGQIGVDLDMSELRPDMSQEDVARLFAKWQEQLDQKPAGKGGAEPGARPGARAKSKREMDREARARAEEELRERNLSQLYKQLAKLLHPDLEQDAGRRREKESAMKELTVAYKAKDLHALLRLEVEWIRNEQSHVEELTEEKLALYIGVFREQVRELEDELRMVPLHPRYGPLHREDGFSLMPMPFNGPRELRDQQKTEADLKESLRRLESDAALDEVRHLIRIRRSHWDPFDPF